MGGLVWFWNDLRSLDFCCNDVERFWDWLRAYDTVAESRSTTIRNLGLLVAATIALPLALWRSIVAGRQAKTANQALLNERYQRGAEMLGDENLSVRIGGIYALQQLAGDFPELYHVNVMRVFCAFVREPTKAHRSETVPESSVKQDGERRPMRADVEAVMQAISYRSSRGISLEQSEKPGVLYFRDADLRHLEVVCANLSRARLTLVKLSDAELPYADLSGARLRQAKLVRANLTRSNLSGALLWGADMKGTVLRDVNLSGADFRSRTARSFGCTGPAHGLTQAQLDEATATSENQPKLDGVVDAETGKPLVWRSPNSPIGVD